MYIYYYYMLYNLESQATAFMEAVIIGDLGAYFTLAFWIYIPDIFNKFIYIKVELFKPILNQQFVRRNTIQIWSKKKISFQMLIKFWLGFLFWMFQITFDSILNSRIKNTKFINVRFKILRCIQDCLTLCMRYIYNWNIKRFVVCSMNCLL